MNGTRIRRIFKLSSTSRNEVRELLQAMFIGEILAPSRRIWIVSPWISDISVIDNSLGSFSAIESTWERRHIRLSEVIGCLLRLGSEVVIITRTAPQNEQFLLRTCDSAQEAGLGSQLLTLKEDILHLKGILGDYFYLSGSMNITYNGVEILDESVTFETEKSAIAEARIEFLEKYGDKLGNG